MLLLCNYDWELINLRLAFCTVQHWAARDTHDYSPHHSSLHVSSTFISSINTEKCISMHFFLSVCLGKDEANLCRSKYSIIKKKNN